MLFYCLRYLKLLLFLFLLLLWHYVFEKKFYYILLKRLNLKFFIRNQLFWWEIIINLICYDDQKNININFIDYLHWEFHIHILKVFALVVRYPFISNLVYASLIAYRLLVPISLFNSNSLLALEKLKFNLISFYFLLKSSL